MIEVSAFDLFNMIPNKTMGMCDGGFYFMAGWNQMGDILLEFSEGLSPAGVNLQSCPDFGEAVAECKDMGEAMEGLEFMI